MASLIGRAEECAALDEVLESARRGTSRTVVLRGEPGIGKTALIEYAIGAAADMQVVVLSGIEAEVELAFAALQRVLIPIEHWIDRLPPPQRGALNAAFGRSGGAPPNRFMVSMAALTLASSSASRQPLLWVVDDAQWVDRESINAFAFCGRRFRADPVALIFAERDTPADSAALDDFPVLHVHGLDARAAHQLLAAATDSRLHPEVAARLIAETAGNPLALAELGRELTSGQLAGAALLPDPLPLSRRLEERFLRQVRTLPASTQRLMLLAAAEPTGEPRLLWGAATLLGIPAEAAEPAESANLLAFVPAVTFRHPLIRSAVYGSAPAAERRRVHGALALMTADRVDVDRRAWHRAAAALSPDEDVAAALERSALRANQRAGYSAEAAFLMRAAELTPDRVRAAERRVASAAAAIAAGSALQAEALIAAALPDLPDARAGAAAERLVGNARAMQGRTSESVAILSSAAVAMQPWDPSLSRRTMLEALEAAALAGPPASVPTNVALDVLRDLGGEATDRSLVDALLVGLATYVTGGYRAAVPSLRRAVENATSESATTQETVRWTLLVSLVTQALWDHEQHHALMQHLVAASRAVGALHRLLLALHGCASADLWAGQLDRAEVLIDEAKQMARAAGNPWSPLMDLGIAAWRGHEAQARATGAETMRLASELGLGVVVGMANAALVVLDLGAGRYAEALTQARSVFEADPLGPGSLVLADMVEGATRVGDWGAATAAWQRLDERANASGSRWALGLLARSRALLADDADAESSYREALQRLDTPDLAMEHTRTRLLYGEWLRRRKRRTDARAELHLAYDAFSGFGAEGFAERSRRELVATGAHARKRVASTAYDLTPQEAQVARLAASGSTNAEIAARLFISASTVEYHLRKVFRKLDLTSRRQLREALPV